jgi:hypothetical protein
MNRSGAEVAIVRRIKSWKISLPDIAHMLTINDQIITPGIE